MLGAISGFSLMAIAARQLTTSLDTFEIMLFRSIIACLSITVFAIITHRAHQLKPKSMPLHIGRSVVHFAGQNLWIFALAHAPLAQVVAIEFSYPLLVTIGAAIFLGEKLTRLKGFTVTLGFLGILIVSGIFISSNDAFAFEREASQNIGLIAAFLCAFGFAGAALITKTLTSIQGITVLNILFWMTFYQMFMGLICAGLDFAIVLPSSTSLMWLALMGWSSLLAHGCMTQALKLAPASIVVPMDFMRLPVIALIGWAFYSENISLTLALGAALIFGANYLNIITAPRRGAQNP